MQFKNGKHQATVDGKKLSESDSQRLWNELKHGTKAYFTLAERLAKKA